MRDNEHMQYSNTRGNARSTRAKGKYIRRLLDQKGTGFFPGSARDLILASKGSHLVQT